MLVNDINFMFIAFWHVHINECLGKILNTCIGTAWRLFMVYSGHSST